MLWQKYAELVAAQATNEGMAPLRPDRNSANSFITHGMTIKIIDLLEVIYIEQNCAEQALLFRLPARFGRLLKESSLIVDSRQWVRDREPDQFPLKRNLAAPSAG